MAVPFKHKDILKAYVSDKRNAAWARDLVCVAIQTGGAMTDAEQMVILDECEQNISASTKTLPPSINAKNQAVRLLGLKHNEGVNALAANQEIRFCEEGITLLYGPNRSGKSGYFRILHQLAAGEVKHQLHKNVYSSAPAAIDVEVEYDLDKKKQPVFKWDGNAPVPIELRHVRFFDSKYADHYLKTRDGNTYFFKSYNLQVFKSINDTLDLLKSLGAAVSPTVESSLRTLCSTVYKDSLSRAMVQAFQEELKLLGMEDIQVELGVDDLLDKTAKIAIRLTNKMGIDGVLSEAELKCASLALFLAEVNLMDVQQPIVMDDPVNSLDAIFIERLADRLRSLDNQVIVFTHSVLFQETLMDIRKFDVYTDLKKKRGTPKAPKRNVFVYDVLSSANDCGYVIPYEKKKTLFYLDEANKLLSAMPVKDEKAIVSILRLAVEWAVDEVVFRGLAPRRFKGSENTSWFEMEKMTRAGAGNVQKLHSIYDQLSATGGHVGYTSYVSGTTVKRLQRLSSEILAVYKTL